MHNRTLIGIVLVFISFFLHGQEQIEKLPEGINSPNLDETSPVISRDGSKMFFTRTADPNFESTMPNEKGEWIAGEKNESYHRELSKIYSQISGSLVSDPVNSTLNQDIWYAPILDDTIQSPFHPGYPLNNALPNSLVSTGMNTNEYILINEFYKDGSMYAGFSRVRVDDDAHTFPEPMYIYGFNTIRSSVNMTMTPNGHTIILSINGPGSTGESDLYVSFYVRDNVWSTPIHMGQVLNSQHQETTPYITPDKRYLYFSSNRPGGVGGNDIYRAERLDYTWLRWSAPVLVSGDVNSMADDSQPYFDPEARYMYFTSRRDGSSDIFRQQLFEKQRLIKPIVVKGKVINRHTGQPTRAEIFWGQLSTKDYLEYFSTYDGNFIVTLTEFEPYKFQLRKSNHTAERILVDPRVVEKQGMDTVEIIFYLDPKDPFQKDSFATREFVMSVLEGDSSRVEHGKFMHASDSVRAREIDEEAGEFYDIFFVKSKAVILTTSEKALLDLYHQLNEQKNIDILIIGHTDNIGDGDALIQLSNERALAVKGYLVAQGIEASRIKTLGMGAENPMFDNETEEGRERNRRVEIKTIKY